MARLPVVALTPKESKVDALWLDSWAKVFNHLVPMIREIEKDREEIAATARRQPSKTAYFAEVSARSEWWRYYEMSERRHIALALFHVGLIPEIVRSVVKGIRGRDLLTPLLEDVPDTEIQPFSPKRTLGAGWSMGNSLRSYIICGRSLNSLVANAEKDDDLLKLAVRIDPLTMYCKPMRMRFIRAAAEHDESFFSRIADALQSPKTVASEQYPELQACLFLLERAKQLPFLNEARAEQLFQVRLKHLRIYNGDPHSLIRYVQRFRHRATTTL